MQCEHISYQQLIVVIIIIIIIINDARDGYEVKKLVCID